MKGVIVKVGEPKSIALLNNGKIVAIPTPANCKVGMVVTVKLNNLLKIIIVILAAVLLIALGVFIGSQFFGGTVDNNYNMPGYNRYRHGRMMEQNR
jgi:putative Mn2+ efflux pump MntP